jgi:hypothetical protein
MNIQLTPDILKFRGPTFLFQYKRNLKHSAVLHALFAILQIRSEIRLFVVNMLLC